MNFKKLCLFLLRADAEQQVINCAKDVDDGNMIETVLAYETGDPHTEFLYLNPFTGGIPSKGK